MKRLVYLIIVAALLLVSFLVTGCAGNADQSSTLNVSAAISMKNSLEKIKELFEKDNPGDALSFNFASSGTLQHQIEQGAPVDVFVSAGEKQMKALEDRSLVGEPLVVAGNELLLITAAINDKKVSNLRELAGPGFVKIAMGNPDTVPAGKYAEEALRNEGVLNVTESKLVLAKDVRQVLAYVETGDVDAGFVYRTDFNNSNEVSISNIVSPKLHSPIVYTAAVVKGSLKKAQTEKFMKFLRSEKAIAVFREHGFTIPKQ